MIQGISERGRLSECSCIRIYLSFSLHFKWQFGWKQNSKFMITFQNNSDFFLQHFDTSKFRCSFVLNSFIQYLFFSLYENFQYGWFHLFNNYLLRRYYVQSSIPNAGIKRVNRREFFVLKEFELYWKEQKDKQTNNSNIWYVSDKCCGEK